MLTAKKARKLTERGKDEKSRMVLEVAHDEAYMLVRQINALYIATQDIRTIDQALKRRKTWTKSRMQ